MADVTYIQTLKIVAGKTPVSGGNTITEKDFQIDPAETLQVNNFNESLCHRFVVEDGTVDAALCQGTISTIKVLVFKPETDLETKLVNAAGTSQNLIFAGGRTSVLHVTLTGILVSNSSGTPIKGVFFIAGD